MIDRSQIQFASSQVRSRAKRCWIRKLSDNQFRVRPNIHDKEPRIVVFLPNGKVMCIKQRSGEICEANEYKNVCYHVYKANQHRERLRNRSSEAA